MTPKILKQKGGSTGGGQVLKELKDSGGKDISAAMTRRDFASAMNPRWCPGCGDYAILNATQTVMAEMGIPRERFVIVSGIGCSSRFPYYMN
ncbi:MAG: hypothetical protein KJ927_06300, partial [Candidatus Eisenbacteria bacterium]|nr:hypothetical protein [Candidatus Eisenbacteria bacterium]